VNGAGIFIASGVKVATIEEEEEKEKEKEKEIQKILQ